MYSKSRLSSRSENIIFVSGSNIINSVYWLQNSTRCKIVETVSGVNYLRFLTKWRSNSLLPFTF